MTNAVLSNFLAPRDEREDGFTLIEILVVIIIIGILAAIAIPIFLNQQRTARDSATTSDVRNLATNIETGLVADPEAKKFAIGKTASSAGAVSGAVAATDTTFFVKVGDGTPIKVSKTSGTVLTVGPSTAAGGVATAATAAPGLYIITGYNADGQNYTAAKKLMYKSVQGGIQ